MSEASPAQIAQMRRNHVGVHQEFKNIANDHALMATREIAAWICTLDTLPDTPEQLADLIEAEFIKPSGEVEK